MLVICHLKKKLVRVRNTILHIRIHNLLLYFICLHWILLVYLLQLILQLLILLIDGTTLRVFSALNLCPLATYCANKSITYCHQTTTYILLFKNSDDRRLVMATLSVYNTAIIMVAFLEHHFTGLIAIKHRLRPLIQTLSPCADSL